MCFLFSDRRLQIYEKIVYGKWYKVRFFHSEGR